MYLTTASGRDISLQNISPEDISILDIAHSLSHQCRFGGHTSCFYSVAQHSVRVAMALPPDLRLAGLLHDATEAYVVDLPRPVKNLLPDYKKLEARVWEAIALRYNLPVKEHPLVNEMDDRALRTEWQELIKAPLYPEFAELRPLPAQAPLLPLDAHKLFLLTFVQLVDDQELGSMRVG